VIWLFVVEVVPPKVHVRDRVVDWAPWAVGFARTLTVQVVFEPARFAVPHVSAVIEKFVASVNVEAEHPVAVAAPEFVNVNAWAVEFEPTSMFPKS
jgi:hypothetical protein